jgi:amino acid adenylation domain-containing protein
MMAVALVPNPVSRTVQRILSQARARGYRVWLDGQKLRCLAPQNDYDDALIASLRTHRDDLVQELRDEIIEHVPRGDLVEPSFAQERLWFLDQLEPGNPFYNMAAAFRIRGELAVAALSRSFDALVERHEILRTTFEEIDGRPRQRVHQPAMGCLKVEDCRDVDDRALRRMIDDEGSAPFDLRTGPLLRARLLVRSGREHVLLITMHHIVSDGWSVGVMAKEVLEHYAARRHGAIPPLPPLAVQYADYAAWQRRWLTGEREAQALEFWRTRMQAAPTAIDLPADRPRPPRMTFRGAALPLAIGSDLAASLRSLAQGCDTTLFTVLLAAFGVLVGRHASVTDVIIGTPVAGRTRPELAPLIGMMANTIPLRVTMDDDPSFVDLVARLRETCLSAFDHQELPFEKIVEAVKPPRDMSRTPLFQVALAVQHDSADAEIVMDELTVERIEPEHRTAKFDLMLDVEATTGAGLDAVLEFNTDLFDRVSVARWGHRLSVLLASIVADPRQRCSRLEMLDTAERELLLRSSSGRSAKVPRGGAVHRIFERQARDNPERIAVVDGGRSLTYRSLDARANQLAHRLREQGVTLESRVGVLVPRSLEFVLAVLGILKAGGVYVPLDADYPSSRLSLMEAIAGVQSRVTAEDLADDVLSQYPVTPPATPVSPENLAYVIFTSGSTGEPKGTMTPHRAIVRLVHEQDFIEVRASDRMALASNTSFDASTLELWAPLLHGATLVVVPKSVVLSVPDLVAFYETTRITMSWLTVGLFNLVVQTRPDAFRRLRYVWTGGDKVDTAGFSAVLGAGPPEHLYNGYGPTETTTFAATHRAVAPESLTGATVPVGQPLANDRIYLLSDDGDLVGYGCVGEVCIAGSGLSRGYIGRPQSTAERFVPDPFGEPGSRMYRSGDLGRIRTDGQIEILGRRDHQVKVRGFRIELGEIETMLASHPQVRGAIVEARGEDAANKRIVAYVTASAASPPAAGELRQYLASRLPDFMVPGAYVVLDAFPLTPNGKVDRRRLPAPATAPSDADALPRNDIEKRLCSLFSEVLGVERIGIRDNFFELGGHSLLATQLTARARVALGKEVEVRHLFEAPTVEKLAERLTVLGADEGRLERVERNRPIPASFAQERLWFLAELEPDSAFYNVPAAYRLRGALDTASLARAFDALVERHESLRTTFEGVAGQAMQRIHPPRHGCLRLEAAHGLGDEQIRAAAMAEAETPFDLATGPLLRARLLGRSEDDNVLLVTLHHAIADGWSVGVMIRELLALYQAFSRREANPLAPLAVQYADYATWQRRWLDGERSERPLAFWTAHLAGAKAALELPADRPRPAVQSYRGAVVEFELGVDLTESLGKLASDGDATLFMVLLAAFGVFLGRHAGQTDVVIGSPIAGRVRAELEPLIGLFVNTLPLRVRFDDDPPFSDLLSRVKHLSLRAFEHQHVPFEKIVEAVQPSRDMSRSPLFQAALAVQNTPNANVEVPGLRCEPMPTELRIAKFDVLLEVRTGSPSLVATLEYNVDLFDCETAVRMRDRLLVFLRAAANRPSTACSRIDLLTPSERRFLLQDWNARSAPLPAEPVHVLFERQAKRAPQALAVIDGQRTLTYAELDARANQLAHSLRAKRLKMESRVGVSIPRSLEFVIAVLGILKAGAAYVALDATYPPSRLKQIVDIAAIDVIVVPADVARDATHDVDAPQSPTDPRNLACVIFTSGSTGEPKGVGILHGGIVRLALNHFFVARPGDRVTLASNTAFDAVTLELWTALLAGATLVVVPHDVLISPPDLAAFYESNDIDLAFLTAGLFNLVAKSHPSAFRRMRYVYTGGDKADPSSFAAVLGSEPPAHLGNAYGPTEITTLSATYRAEHGSKTDASVPIGRPIANDRIYLLSAAGDLVPLGCIGEVCIGGAGVSRGYLSRPALTAERFVPDPFGAQGGRLYRTGDMARIRQDGELEFIGRRDHQVKVRGFRIELGEIEVALRTHPSVEEVVVVAREASRGDKQLIAYISTQPGRTATPQSLREHVAAHLPDFMVPSRFFFLAGLPLTANGKIDRSALPVPERAPAEDYAAPRTPLEAELCAIFGEVLGVEKVGLDGNFFAMGGHSLMAMKLLARLREVLGADLTLAELLTHPTVRGLLERGGSEALVPLQAHGSRVPLVLVHPMTGDVFCYGELARHLHDRPVFGLRSPRLRDDGPPPGSLAELVCAYADLIVSSVSGPFVLGGWSAGGLLALEIAHQLDTRGHTALRGVLLIDSYPLDPTPDSAGGSDDEDAMAEAMAIAGGHPDTTLSQRMMGVFKSMSELLKAHRRPLPANRVWHVAAEGSATIARPFVGLAAQRAIRGNHYDILNTAHASELAAAIDALLATE